MTKPFPLTPVKELEGLIEALNEATLDPLVRSLLAADPLGALRDLGIALPEGIGVAITHSPGGRTRLVLTTDGPLPLGDDILDEVVGGTLAPFGTGVVIASFDL